MAGRVLSLSLSHTHLQHTHPRHTDNEPKAGMLRLVLAGGRATESTEPGPAGAGAIGVGTRALSESGTAGGWQRQQVRLCGSPLQTIITCRLRVSSFTGQSSDSCS